MELTLKKVHMAEIRGLNDGPPILARRIGRGRFWECWQESESSVLLIRRLQGDYSKEILTDCDPMPHIPQCERVGHIGDKEVYRSPFYATVRAADESAWMWFRRLEAARDAAWQKVMVRRNEPWSRPLYCGVDVMQETIEATEGGPIRRALEELRDASANYGSSYTFEFAKRNLGVDTAGRLILRDVVFDLESCP